MGTPKTIAIDFDGVLHGYSKGWKDGSIYDKPVFGAGEAMQMLLEQGFEVVIYSTRCHDREVAGVHQKNQVKEMRDWLVEHDIPYSRIHIEPGKPLCKLFVGQRIPPTFSKQHQWFRILQD